MNRRDLIKLGAFVPVSALAQHGEHPAAAVEIATEARHISDPNWKPGFLSAHENDTVIALSDLIIPQTDTPGAKAALVNRYIDKILGDDEPRHQKQLTGGIARLDDAMRKKHGKTFVELSSEQQYAELERLDQSHDPFFALMKAVTSQIYYSTKIGWDELNKGVVVPSSFHYDCPV